MILASVAHIDLLIYTHEDKTMRCLDLYLSKGVWESDCWRVHLYQQRCHWLGHHYSFSLTSPSPVDNL